MRPFRFGVQAYGAAGGDGWRQLARTAEAAGYSILTMPDHFGEKAAVMPSLVAAADATERLRVGPLVMNNDLWNPVQLARDAATVDVLSGGRFELGVGAGWRLEDYRWAGRERDPAGERIERLGEGLHVMKGAFSGEPFSFSGRHYQVSGLEGWPPPVQRPHPPIFVGGSGPKILAIAAREADVVGVHINLSAGDFVIGRGAAHREQGATAAEIDRRLEWIRREAGARFESLELHLFLLEVAITERPREAAARFAPAYALSEEEMLGSPYFQFGTADGIAAALEEVRARFGISYVTVRLDHLELFAPVVERLAGR